MDLLENKSHGSESRRQTVLNARSVVAVFGTGGILAGVLFLAAAFAIGWALGGPTADTRVVLGIATFQRNVAAPLVVAGQSFDDPNVTVMIIVVTVISMLILIPLTKALGRRAPPAPRRPERDGGGARRASRRRPVARRRDPQLRAVTIAPGIGKP